MFSKRARYATLQFYDGAVGNNNPPTVTAGAQDNGNWLYEGGSQWGILGMTWSQNGMIRL